MLNVVVVMGRMVVDPEPRKTLDGTDVTSFRIAVDRDYVKPGEERQTDFFDVVAWRGAATFVCNYFRKGSLIAIQGWLQMRTYEDKNGKKRTVHEIVAEKVNFCERPKRDEATGRPEAQPQPNIENDEGNDDLPF